MKTKILIAGFAFLFVVLLSRAFRLRKTPSRIPKYGKDSIKTLTKLSLYQEFYNQWQKDGYKGNSIHDALNSWRWVFDNAPRSSQNLYIHGTKMYRYLINKAEKESRKEGLVEYPDANI
ncbi:MAG: hypothetical protein U5L09_22210 [Bacteroidales bacterium]|nr:hypothetical protein [Bacteroidales bacterium]